MEDIPSIAVRLNRIRNQILAERYRSGSSVETTDTGYFAATHHPVNEACKIKFTWNKWSEIDLADCVEDPVEFQRDARELHEYFIQNKLDVICFQSWYGSTRDNYVTFVFAEDSDNKVLMAKLAFS